MNRKSTLAIIFAMLLLLAISTVALAGDPGVAAHQDMPTATPVPLVTPQTSSGTYMDGSTMSSCPMMGGMAGTGTMTSMGSMPMGGGMNMNNMGSMGSTGGMMMSGMNMQGSNMQGMSNMPSMGDNYFVLTDPTTWFSSNPWILLGWVVLGMVLLALLAGLALGVFWFARRLAVTRTAGKS